MRRIIEFTCESAMLAGTLDGGTATTGLLIISGGNEIRIGAHRGMAQLARDVAANDYPVFRFDRRGIGDSEGVNCGFESSRADIGAALSAFRRECPSLKRIVAFGNCDAATALWLHQPLAIDAMILANPWLFEATPDQPGPASTRAYYGRRVRDPLAWAGLFKGAVSFRKMFGSLRTATKGDRTSSLAERVAETIAMFPVDTNILLAERDGTAVAFSAQWESALFNTYRQRISVVRLDSASHSFASDADYEILRDTMLRVLTN